MGHAQSVVIMATNDVVTGGAVVAGIIAILIALRPYILHKKHITLPLFSATREMAGSQPLEFWEKRFDKIDGAVATLDLIMREHRGLTRGEIEELRDLLVDIDTNIKVAIATRPPIRSREREDR